MYRYRVGDEVMLIRTSKVCLIVDILSSDLFVVEDTTGSRYTVRSDEVRLYRSRG